MRGNDFIKTNYDHSHVYLFADLVSGIIPVFDISRLSLSITVFMKANRVKISFKGNNVQKGSTEDFSRLRICRSCLADFFGCCKFCSS